MVHMSAEWSTTLHAYSGVCNAFKGTHEFLLSNDGIKLQRDMYSFMYVHISAKIATPLYVNKHVCMHLRMYVCIYLWSSAFMDRHMDGWMVGWMHEWICMYMHTVYP